MSQDEVDRQASLTQKFHREIWPRLAQTFMATIHRSAYAQRVFLTQHSIDDLYQWTFADMKLLEAALELLYATRGQVRMEALAAHCCLSLRQLERRFKQRIGTSPKTFARLLRFEALLDSLIRDGPARLADLASRFGYQDQAHLIHEFKLWSGYTPRMFIALARYRSSQRPLYPDLRCHTCLFSFERKG